MTKQEASKLVAALFAAYPSMKSASGTGPLYERMLLDLREAKTATTAIKRIIESSKFWPSVAEIRDAYDLEREREIHEASKKALPPPPIPDAEERAAWAKGVVEQLAKGFAP